MQTCMKLASYFFDFQKSVFTVLGLREDTFPHTCSHKAQNGACQCKDQPGHQSEAPTESLGQQGDAVGGKCTAYVGAGIQYAGYGRNLSCAGEEGRDHTYQHQVNTVHGTGEQCG